MKWQIKALYLYKNNKYWAIEQLYEEVFGDTGADELYINSDHYKEWRLNSRLHRENGPAMERANGTKYWYLNGYRHCEDGPAYESGSGYKEWYINGEKLTEKQFNRRKK